MNKKEVASAQRNESIANITNALLEDLFNPSIAILDLCTLHDLSLPQLAAILESESFHSAKSAFDRINSARHSILESESKTLALARLADQLKDNPASPAHAETQRKSATKLLSITSTRPNQRIHTKPQVCTCLKTQTDIFCSQSPVKVTVCDVVEESHTRQGLQRKSPQMNLNCLAITALAVASASASAQSFNVDWGSLDSSPPNTYAAQGLAGHWNTFDSMPNFQRLPLLGLDGQPIAADIMNIGFDVIESSDIAGTSGGDELLLDDCFTSFNDPIDGCIFMRFLEPGEYQVILYSMAPDDTSLISRLRIDQNELEPEFVGGEWTGAHENGISYMTQTATVGSDGRLDLHSGLQNANIRSVLNGMQVIQLGACQPDLNEDGDLNFFDVSAFLSAFGANDPAADFNGDDQYNFFDVSAFLTAFGAGCP
jgi:hypothetical protein